MLFTKSVNKQRPLLVVYNRRMQDDSGAFMNSNSTFIKKKFKKKTQISIFCRCRLVF